MARMFHRVTKPAAQSPGTVEFSGERKVEHTTMKVIDFDAGHFEERDQPTVGECASFRAKPTTTWINVNGLHDIDLLQSLGDAYGLHGLVMEDIAHTHQRPKLEDYGDYIYIVCRMLSFDDTSGRLLSEQLSLVIGKNTLISFQERPGDVLGPVRERLRQGKGRIRGGGAGYLAYALLDAVVDHYFILLDGYGDQIDELEDMMVEQPSAGALHRVHALKREMVLLRRAVSPLREVLASMDRDETPLLGSETSPYMRDVYDHIIQVTEAVDGFRDILGGLQDLYLSSVSNRMNDVMKVLTVFASIFVPLTFLAGVYGMNFTHMPELAWRWSYPIFWVVIVSMVSGMLTYFRRKKWL